MDDLENMTIRALGNLMILIDQKLYKFSVSEEYKAIEMINIKGITDDPEVEVFRLIQLLRNGNDNEREKAASELGKIGEKDTIQPLIEALEDKKADVRKKTASALGEITEKGDTQSNVIITKLTSVLIDKSEDDVVRQKAASALGKMTGKAAVDPLIQVLTNTSEDTEVRQKAASALGKITGKAAVDPLIQVLTNTSEDTEVRIKAASALGKIAKKFPSKNRKIITSIVQVLTNTSEDTEIRQKAASALGEAGDPDAIEHLAEVFKDDNVEIRRRAAYALEQIGDPSGIEHLAEVLKGDPNIIVRQKAASALGKIAKKDSPGIGNAVNGLADALKDKNVGVRRKAAYSLREIAKEDPLKTRAAIDTLDQVLIDIKEDPYVRQRAASALGEISLEDDAKSKAVVRHLVQILVNKEEDSCVRQKAASALGKMTFGDLLESEDVIKSLAKVLTDTSENTEIRQKAASILGEIGKRYPPKSKGIIKSLAKVLTDTSENTEIRQKAASALSISHGDAINHLARAVKDEKCEIRQEAVSALGDIGKENGDNSKDAIEYLAKVLTKDKNAVVRRMAVYALGDIGKENGDNSRDAIKHLAKALISDAEENVRLEAALFIQASTALTWREKIDQIIRILQERGQKISDVDFSAILRAIVPSEKEIAKNRYLLVDYLISKATDQDQWIIRILARLIIMSCGENTILAGERVNEFQDAHDISDDDLRILRMEIGGETALGPVMQALRENLKNHFQKPIDDLNKDTRHMWHDSIRNARYGFVIRTVMSVIVFSIGIWLLIAAGRQFLSGALQITEFLGPSVSFAGGMAAILGTIYKGPLSDIRKSVDDLGIANAAFIGYIHRVLEISHTFSFYYLQNMISFENTKKSSDLIDIAMKETIKELDRDRQSTYGEVAGSSKRKQDDRIG